jgi:hypothetical protein
VTPSATFLICEDGHEYLDRFSRLLGGAFHFLRATCLAEALAAVAGAGARGATPAISGMLLDLDFRRTPPAALIDDAGQSATARPDGERRQLVAMQGILILRALRRAGVALPALLFADLEDADQITFLQADLAPLQVIPSGVGLQEIGRMLGRLAGPPGA